MNKAQLIFDKTTNNAKIMIQPIKKGKKMQTFPIHTPSVTSQWVTYTLQQPDNGEVYYVGCCRYSEVMMMPDARKRQGFIHQTYNMTITGLYQTRAEAIKAQSVQSSSYYNAHGKLLPLLRASLATDNNRVIVDTTTGQLYRTIAEAAQQTGVHQSALCNHLNGKAGYNHVSNRIFKRIPCNNVHVMVKLRQGQTAHLNELNTQQPLTIPPILPLEKNV